MLKDEAWPVARLIPTTTASGVEALERRATSALLAVVGAVDEFGRALLKPLGAPAGKIETFIETPFKLSDGRSIRPDGIIFVSRGSRTWSAVVETKVGTSPLEPPQIDAYLDLAKELNFDAVLSLSNQFVTSSSAYPIDVDRRKVKRIKLRHWSWIDVLTEAVVQKEHRGIKDSDQAWILEELIRYLSDPRSGVIKFDSMGPSWTAVKEGARGQTLGKNDDDVRAAASRWDDLVRFIGLELTKELGQDVKQVLPKEEQNPTARQSALRESLSGSGQLYAQLNVPNAVGPLRLVADLRTRQVSASTQLDAPREGRSKGRVSWLLRQLQDAPDDLRLETKVARSSTSYASTLAVAKDNPDSLFPEGDKEIRQFRISLTRNMGLNRDRGRGSFIDSVLTTTEEFYVQVLQNLRAWKARPPKLQRKSDVDEPTKLPQKVEDALNNAEAEMGKQVSSVAPESDSAP